MKHVTPSVRLLARPSINWKTVYDHIVAELGGSDAAYCLIKSGELSSGEALTEFMARLCYRSFEPGLNANVTRVRTDHADYFENILRSRHGSVLAHAHYSFVFHNVSRVFTHEVVRHAAGTDISQESLRFVRLDDIRVWLPDWVRQDEELADRCEVIVQMLEAHQRWMTTHFTLDDPGVAFTEKKAKTSFMRRFAPEGLATTIGMTFNVRALRHVLEMRYAEHAEEEMHVVMPQLFAIMRDECSLLFNDYTVDGENLRTEYRKV